MSEGASGKTRVCKSVCRAISFLQKIIGVLCSSIEPLYACRPLNHTPTPLPSPYGRPVVPYSPIAHLLP